MGKSQTKYHCSWENLWKITIVNGNIYGKSSLLMGRCMENHHCQWEHLWKIIIVNGIYGKSPLSMENLWKIIIVNGKICGKSPLLMGKSLENHNCPWEKLWEITIVNRKIYGSTVHSGS